MRGERASSAQEDGRTQGLEDVLAVEEIVDGRLLLNQCSILAHVAPGSTSQVENLATESLLYLLRRYAGAREAFVDLVSTLGYVGPRELRFDTQVHMEYGSIPDLVGATAAGANVLLVESKFWAPLTSNHPTGYLERLPEDGEGMVLFVAPEKRYDELWQQLVTRCRNKDLELSEVAVETPNRRAARCLRQASPA